MTDELIQHNSAVREDDDIDLMQYIFVIFRYSYILILFVLLGIGAGYHLNKKLLMTYSAKTTFYLPGSSGGGASAAGGAIASLLGGGGANLNEVGSYIFMVMSTDLLKDKIALDMQRKGFFKNESVDAVKIKLELGKLKVESVGYGIYALSYAAKDPVVILPVLDSTFNSLQSLNEDLKILTKRDFIFLLDKAKSPIQISPDKNKNYMLGIGSSFVLGIVVIFVIDFMRKSYRKLKTARKGG
jgi:capsular polysaccharide biosynthesis protein